MNCCIDNKLRICLGIFWLLMIVHGFIYLMFPEYHISIIFKAKIEQKSIRMNFFRPISTNGIFTFSNVCLELLPSPRIVSYDETQKRIGTQRVMGIYDVHFTNESLPQRNRTITDQVAYFVAFKFPGNLHHFMEDDFIPLYSVVRQSNMLFPGADNFILYPFPKTGPVAIQNDLNTYDEIMRTLHTNGFHDVYYNVPSNTCFRKAVFGTRKILNDSRDVVNYLIRSYNLTEICSPDKASYVTILSRKYRRIINIDDLFRWTLNSGFEKESVRIIDFQKFSIREQMIIACTSKLMIGINGAGLQWSMLMPEGSHVVEMSWPSRCCAFYYPRLLQMYRLNHHSVEVKDIRLNFTSYELRVRNGVKVGVQEMEQMKKSPPGDLWMWSDAFLHYEELNKTLENLFKVMCNETHLFRKTSTRAIV